MAFLGGTTYRDVGDMSDISDVSADELARMVEDADDLDSHIFGSKKPSKETKPTSSKVTTSPKQPRIKSGDIFGDDLLPDNGDAKDLQTRKSEDRSDWLGLKVDLKPRPSTGQITQAAGSGDTKRPQTSAGPSNIPVSPVKGDPPVASRRSVLPVSSEIKTPLQTPVAGKRNDRASLIQDLFGPPSWERKKDDKPPIQTPVVPDILKDDDKKSEFSYVPSVGEGSGGRRAGSASRPRPQVSLDEFDIDINPQPPSLVTEKGNIPDWLAGPKTDRVSFDKDVNKVATTSTPIRSEPHGILKQPSVVPKQVSPQNAIGQPEVVQQAVSGQQLQQPFAVGQPMAPVNVSQPLQFQMQYFQIQESVEGDKQEMVGALASAQATLGAAMARHHSNMHTYMKSQIKNLEVDNFNLKMRVESLKTSHQLEIDSFRKAAQHDALLWEARIERLQHFCFEIEREYSNKIEKMKESEEDLIKTHKMRLEALQEERLDEVRRLNDLHKVILEQALSVTVMYPQYYRGTGNGGGSAGFKLPIRMPERPENEKELVEREQALLEKEKILEVGRAELEAMREGFAEDRRKTEEEIKDRDAVVRAEENKWKETKLREERELAKKEESAKQLIKQAEQMREDAIAEVSSLAKEKLIISTERAKLEAVMKSQSGDFVPNTDHLFQVRAEVEAGLEESRKAQASLDTERKRLVESHRRIDEWQRQLEERERELDERERRVGEEMERASMAAEDAESRANAAKRRADAAVDEAKRREQIAEDKAAELDRQISELAREKMEVTREKYEMEAAKSRLEVLLPELSPAETLKFVPARNYVNPKSVIMRLRAEKDLECLAVPKRKYI